jgi:hypothetical protein
MSNCRSGCDTQDHENYAKCLLAANLSINSGDATAGRAMSTKKWDGELAAYRDARAQGIQPAGTTMKKINEARAASDKLGVAFDAGTMPDARKITKRTAKVMKETGAI